MVTQSNVPIPDPTILTTEQLHREIESQRQIIDAGLKAAKEITESRLDALEKITAATEGEEQTYRAERDRLTESRLIDINRRLDLIASDLKKAVDVVDHRAQTANDTLERLVNAKHDALVKLAETKFDAAQTAITKVEAVSLAVDIKAQTANDTLERLVTANHHSLTKMVEVRFEATEEAIKKVEKTAEVSASTLDTKISTLSATRDIQLQSGLTNLEKSGIAGMATNSERIKEQIGAVRDALSTSINDVKERLASWVGQIEKTTAAAALAMDKRLDSITAFKDTVRDQTSAFATRNELSAFHNTTSDNIKSIEARIATSMSRTEIMAQIEPISEAARRLENRGSNLDGRFWAVAIIPAALVLLIMLGVLHQSNPTLPIEGVDTKRVNDLIAQQFEQNRNMNSRLDALSARITAIKPPP
jgi:hypothetical protein